MQGAIDAVLRAHESEIRDQKALPALSFLVRLNRSKSLRIRSIANDKHVLRPLAASFKGNASVRLVRRDDDISSPERQALRGKKRTVKNVTAPITGFVELGSQVVMIEDQARALTLDGPDGRGKEIRRVARMDDVERTGRRQLPDETPYRPKGARVFT